MKSKGPEAVTALDQFRIQEAAMNVDVAESEKHYDRIIEEQTKIREGATAARAKAQAVLAGMIEDYERIDAELEGEAAKRMDLAGLTKHPWPMVESRRAFSSSKGSQTRKRPRKPRPPRPKSSRPCERRPGPRLSASWNSSSRRPKPNTTLPSR